jgi:hypothetical protein
VRAAYQPERPRNWDLFTGLPVPPKIRMERMFPFVDAATRDKFRESRPHDLEFMCKRIRVRQRMRTMMWLLMKTYEVVYVGFVRRMRSRRTPSRRGSKSGTLPTGIGWVSMSISSCRPRPCG